MRRIYAAPEPDDGFRVLVDRLWPRGIAKEKAALDEWAKDVAPSTELRRWYGHDPAKHAEFRARYLAELDDDGPAVERLRAEAAAGRVTLLTSVKDPAAGHVPILLERLEGRA
ncbi:DUF488 domain-containing protein [Actinomadura parmotrematis]|nr:DUF488 family protein [Actinomadura parmotrematis]